MSANSHEMVSEALKSSPPVTVVSLALGGITLQDWVLIATLIYTLLQIGWLIYSKMLRKPQGDE